MTTIPVLDLKLAEDLAQRQALLNQLREALFNVGFLYVTNHGVPEETISDLEAHLPAIFDLSEAKKQSLSKINSPHFLGYTGFAEEYTKGALDLREQFDFATELPVVFGPDKQDQSSHMDFSKLYWRLRGPNQWPSEDELPGFRRALENYHDALSELSYRFVHLVEEAFGIPVGTFDHFFGAMPTSFSENLSPPTKDLSCTVNGFLPPQHRLKLAKYHAVGEDGEGQGVGPHKDSSGWLTFLHQVGGERGLEVLDNSGDWIPAHPIARTFVVNFGNAFEAATEGAVRATVHRVKAPSLKDRYSIPFFMGLPLNLKVSEIRSFIPENVRSMRREREGQAADELLLPSFLDERWDSLGESVLRKWIRAHQNVGLKWYGPQNLEYYTQ